LVQTTPPTEAERRLFSCALQIQPNSYSPYSGFRVGAAVETEDGRVFAGTNMSNASYPVSACAEQAAVSAAISAGARRIARAAVVGDSDSVSPCGKCRQLLTEFALPGTTVTYRWHGELVTARLADLLPHSFELDKR
jgi:cytidine deaminase